MVEYHSCNLKAVPCRADTVQPDPIETTYWILTNHKTNDSKSRINEMKIEIATDHIAPFLIATTAAAAITPVAVQTTQEQETTTKIVILTIAVVSITAIVLAHKPKSDGEAKKK